MMYTIMANRKQSWIIRFLNFILRYHDPEDEAQENYKKRIMDRYKK